MSLAMTPEQMRELDEQGFTVMESFIQGEELAALVAFADSQQSRAPTSTIPESFEGHLFMDLIDHPRILPYIVDAIGWNVHMRDCIFGPVAPRTHAATPERLSAAWHFDQEEEYHGLTANGEMPLVDFKVSYYLSDHTEPGHSCTCLVPGSHRWSPAQRASWEDWLAPEHVVPLRVPIGTVLLWRSSLLHAVSPHLADSWRYHLYFSYIPRWAFPSTRASLSTAAHPDPAKNEPLLRRSSPIRRQLLGAMGDLSRPDNKLFLFPATEAQVPLKAWAESQPKRDRSFGGTTGHGVSFSRGLQDLPSLPLDQRGAATRLLFASDSPQVTRMAAGSGYRNMMNAELSAAMSQACDKTNAWRDLAAPATSMWAAAAAAGVGGSGGVVSQLQQEVERLQEENERLRAKL
jgi:ectoine hydroxylase-related dioxygenase (phytanoyl-CoA dioxygenase family)